MDRFYDDLIHYLIQFSGKEIEADHLNQLLKYYKGLIDPALYLAIKQRIEIFLVDAQDYYEKNTDPQTDSFFLSLPNRIIKGVVKDIDAALFISAIKILRTLLICCFESGSKTMRDSSHLGCC